MPALMSPMKKSSDEGGPRSYDNVLKVLEPLRRSPKDVARKSLGCRRAPSPMRRLPDGCPGCRLALNWGLIDSWCKRTPGAALPPMMRWRAGALRGYAAARGDENIDYMVARNRHERCERRTARAGFDSHGGQPAADLLPGMRRTVQITSQHLLANALGSIRSRSAGHC
jgi:hypothetical protein